MVVTIANHGRVNGDQVKFDDGAIRFSCTYSGGGNGDSSTAGTVNTGSGGGGGVANRGAGGSGVVILRYPNTKSITVGAGLVSSSSTNGSDKIEIFTAGTGTVSFS